MSVDPGEGDLLAQAIAGDTLSFQRLLMDHYADVAVRIERGLPRSLRASVGVDDLVQETFAEAFRSIRAFRPEGPGSFARWLGTLAEHRVIDAARYQRAAKRGGGWRAVAPPGAGGSVAGLLDLLLVNEHTPSRSVSGREAAAAVHAALAGLKPEYRDALRLRYIHALNPAEVAARMGKTESSVLKLCARGLQQLRESLGEAGRYLSRT